MTSTALNIARRELGEDSSPDLVAAASTVAAATIDRLAEAIGDADHVPAQTPGSDQLWPLINARTSTFSSGGSKRFYARASGNAGLNLTTALDPDFAGSGKFPNGMLRTLLYCHGLTIEDPLAMAADMYLDAEPELRPLARRSLEAGLASMAEISELLDAGIVDTFFTPSDNLADGSQLAASLQQALATEDVQLDEDDVWLAFEASFIDGLQPHLQQLWKLIRAGDRNPPLDLVEEALANSSNPELVETFIDVVAAISPRGVVANAIDVVAHAAADLGRYGGHNDLLCPSDLFAQLAFVGTPKPLDEVRLSELARLQVPRLDDLLTNDAIRIRQDSEAFAAWRATLSQGLERARSLRQDSAVAPGAASQVMAETVAEARAAIFAESERSSVISKGWTGLLGFVAGAVAGASGTATGTAGAIAIGTAGGMIPPLVERVIAAADDRGFLRRHYLVFEPARLA